MSDSTPIKVSVVIPLYNKAEYIRRALDSVMAQGHQDFEIVVVDDGSTDNGAEVVSEYEDPRIRLIRQPNAGVSAARNAAVRAATSEFIALLDADDEWKPDFLETVLGLHAQFPQAGICGTAYVEIHPGGSLRHQNIPNEVAVNKDGSLIDFFTFSLSAEQPCNASSSLLRREVLLAVGGFPENLVRLEDTVTLFAIALRHPVAYSPVAKAIYHMEADNRSDAYLYSGNFPFFSKARELLRERGETESMPPAVLQYLGYMHTGGLYRNWLAGNSPAMREIIRDCRDIPGYRLKCVCWSVLAGLPHNLILAFWRLYSKFRGRVAILPRTRSIFRQASTV